MNEVLSLLFFFLAAFSFGYLCGLLRQEAREETKYTQEGVYLNKPADWEKVEDAFEIIIADVQRDLKIGNPGILTSDIATLAGCTIEQVFSAMCELERGIPDKSGKIGRPPCVHRSGDRWYKGDGAMRQRR
jgi:hypothetical protein